MVGDVDQAIYSWRGAEVANIRERFDSDFQGAETVLLRKNYRSTATIVKAAQAVIDESAQRSPLELDAAVNPGGKDVAVVATKTRWGGGGVRGAGGGQGGEGRRADEGDAVLYGTHGQPATAGGGVHPRRRAGTSWWSLPPSTPARRSKTAWRTFACCSTRATRCLWRGSSTPRRGKSARLRQPAGVDRRSPLGRRHAPASGRSSAQTHVGGSTSRPTRPSATARAARDAAVGTAVAAAGAVVAIAAATSGVTAGQRRRARGRLAAKTTGRGASCAHAARAAFVRADAARDDGDRGSVG